MGSQYEIDEALKTLNDLIYDFEKEACEDREHERPIFGDKYSIPLNMISAKLEFLYKNYNGFSEYNANAYSRLYNAVFDKNIAILCNDLFTINFSRIDRFMDKSFFEDCQKEYECVSRGEFSKADEIGGKFRQADKADVLLSKNFIFSKECIDNMIDYINYIRHFECMCSYVVYQLPEAVAKSCDHSGMDIFSKSYRSIPYIYNGNRVVNVSINRY